MALPRRFLVIAASALAAGAVLYLRNRMQRPAPAEGERKSSGSSSPSSSSAAGASSSTAASQAGSAPSSGGAASATTTTTTGAPAEPGSIRELSLFLAGESWYDEVGWQGIWDREAIDNPDGWLRSTGKDVLSRERKKLAEHPALLAGCRRRWIVVCRYAGIDVADAASLWNATEV